MKFRTEQEWLEAVLKDKEQMRRELAQLPYEEKIARLRRLKRIAHEIAKVREQLRRQTGGSKREN
ncbi:MAG: hypothetical protein RMK89_05475 [Armatimonadota bacterium]|nr:hypothetical protein [Armatimonadota bacterium]MDW8142897.1 hypothetical protein [Armatimonadota bacterium]